MQESNFRLGECYQNGRFGLSFEIFPPKTIEGEKLLHEALKGYVRREPSFISCTYGAGGSTSKRTLEWCRAIQDEFSVPATAHITCIGSSADELLALLSQCAAAGIKNVMALRGDRPKDAPLKSSTDSLRHACQLVELVRKRFPRMGIGVAGYPEKHPEAPDETADLQHLVQKVKAGADAVFTQLFFDNDRFLRFRDRLDEAGVAVPVVPGVMPIVEFDRIARITSLCGATIPQPLSQKLHAARNDRSAQFEIGLDYATEQCRHLLREGIPGLHLYALNRSASCDRLLENLGIPREKAVAYASWDA